MHIDIYRLEKKDNYYKITNVRALREDPRLRMESFAIENFHGVPTKLYFNGPFPN